MRTGIALLACAIVASLALPGRASASWCGTDESSQDRRPDAVPSWQYHPLYAIPSDGEDRFFAVAGAISSDLSAIERWWRREDPTRTPRFDLYAFSNCAADAGVFDLSFVRLPHDGAYYQPHEGRLSRIETDLLDGGALSSHFKKYLVYYDGPVGSEDVCGEARAGLPFDRSYALVYLRKDGCGSLGTAGYEAIVAVHEMLHSFDALTWPFPNPGPPHPCSDLAHPCDSGNDVLWSGGYCCLFDRVLDYGRDDYYGHGKPWTDVRNSPFLRHLDAPQFPLSISVVGSATARIYSEPEGIDCPGACSAVWDAGTRVKLLAVDTNGGYRFARWSGGCVGTTDECALDVTGATAVTATFAAFTPRRLTLRVSVRGPGRVEGAARCSAGTCRRAFATDAVARLRAVPSRGARFAGWQGACRGRGSCAIRMRRSTSVTAVFAR